MRFRIYDHLRTGPRGRIRIHFLNQNKKNKRGPSVINIGPNSEVDMKDFSMRLTDPPQTKGFLKLIRGTIRMWTQNWGSGSSFSIRTGVALCGIRGTDIEIVYNPVAEEVTYSLRTGTIRITPGSGRVVTLQPGHTLTVHNGKAGRSRPLAGPPA